MRSCNRHADCDEADRKAKKRYEENALKPYKDRIPNLQPWADHCHDECCEECFGS